MVADLREGSAADYPFDPNANISELYGLDRLRAIPDRDTAQALYELYWVAERNERDSAARARRQAEENEKARLDMEHLRSMAGKAFAGAYGNAAKAVAWEMLRDESGAERSDLRTLRALRTALQKVPGRVSA